MKKYFKYISAFALVVVAAMSLSSCGEKGLGETIFPDVKDELDPNSYTYKFDKWLQENYLKVYNLEFQYKLQDNETNMNYNLEPATLSNAVDLAVLAKYMWFDVYEEVSGSKEFVKMYGPRIIMLVGSSAINPQSGTEIVGLAEGGIKVTLLKVNSMNPMNIYALNSEYFHTMHHEFTHILHQTKSIPREFQLISLGRYDALNWQSRNLGVVHSLGFVTTYGSSEIREDFAEIAANYITKTDAEWERIWLEAGRGYATDGDEDSEDMDNLVYYCFYYFENNDATNEENKKFIEEYRVQENEDGTYVYKNQYQRGVTPITTGEDGNRYDANGNMCDNAGFVLDKNGNRIPIQVFPVEDKDGVDGVAILEQKINIVRTWFKEQWGLDLDAIRNEVQERVNTFDASILESLRQQVYGAQ
jgi:substrate import-associated zinc metallohydrolase lipoprotein